MKSKLIKLFLAAFIGIFGFTGLCVTPVFADDNTDACKNVCNEDCTVPDAVKTAAGCKSDVTKDTLSTDIVHILNAVIAVLGVIAVIFVIIGGVNFMTSSGDAGKVKKAKDTILYAVIGLVICALSFAIVNFVIANILKADSAPSQNPSAISNSKECTEAGFTWDIATGKCSENPH